MNVKVRLKSWTLDYIHAIYSKLPESDDLPGWSQLFKDTDFTSPEAQVFKMQWEKENENC